MSRLKQFFGNDGTLFLLYLLVALFCVVIASYLTFNRDDGFIIFVGSTLLFFVALQMLRLARKLKDKV